MTSWPELPIAAWRDTCATLQLCTQIVGKIRLALTPKMNQWWNVPLYVTARGLTTSPMPYGERLLSIDFDLIDHRIVLLDSEGRTRSLPLGPLAVCDFYHGLMAELAAMGVTVKIGQVPQECPVATLFSEDREHASYDPDQVRSFLQALQRIEPVFQRF